MDYSSAGFAFGVGFFTILAVVIVWYVLQIVAYWRIFNKAGEPGWKSIIPIYNLYTQYKFSWKTSMFWITLLLLIVGYVMVYLNAGDVVTLIGDIVVLVGLILVLISYYKLGKAFGHGAGLFIAFLLVEPIAMLYLGFNSSEYIGNQSE